MLQKMDLSKKLENLSRPDETLKLQDLVGKPEALIISARRVTTRYGKPAVVLDIYNDNLGGSLFLPKKFVDTLDDNDLQLMVQNQYKIKVEQNGQTSSPNVIIFK